MTQCWEVNEPIQCNITKLDGLFAEKIKEIDVEEIYSLNMADPIYGYASKCDEDAIIEFSNFASKFMKRFDIGKHLSPRKWSQNARQDIQRALRSLFNPEAQTVRPDSLQLQDEIRNKVSDKYSNSDIAVVARTEVSKMKAVVQLLKWQEAGLTHVRYRTKGDSKVRSSHAQMNNKVFSIKELLENEEIRIPITANGQYGFNCRCFYSPHIQR
jgi:SPP1 gp7 family putative phage head morphogenesis protein